MGKYIILENINKYINTNKLMFGACRIYNTYNFGQTFAKLGMLFERNSVMLNLCGLRLFYNNFQKKLFGISPEGLARFFLFESLNEYQTVD